MPSSTTFLMLKRKRGMGGAAITLPSQLSRRIRVVRCEAALRAVASLKDASGRTRPRPARAATAEPYRGRNFPRLGNRVAKLRQLAARA